MAGERRPGDDRTRACGRARAEKSNYYAMAMELRPGRFARGTGTGTGAGTGTGTGSTRWSTVFEQCTQLSVHSSMYMRGPCACNDVTCKMPIAWAIPALRI
jgi:hypothetical protein